MPRARDETFEALVAEVALEERLQPEAYFVQNVVDLQDRLDTRHLPSNPEPRTLAHPNSSSPSPLP